MAQRKRQPSKGADRASARPDLLDNLNLLLTTRCNLKCAYCYQGSRPGVGMSWLKLQSALDWALAHSGERLGIAFSGGEPLLERDLILRVVDHVERSGPPDLAVDYTLMTNGLLLDVDLFRSLTRRGAEIRLSFDGVEAAQHLRGSGTFTLLDETVDRLRAADERAFADQVMAVMTITPDNLPHFAAGVDYLLAKGIRCLNAAAVLTPCPGWDEPDLALMREQFERVRLRCLAAREQGGADLAVFLDRHDLPPRQRPDQGPACAAAGVRKAAVDTDGRLYSCPIFAGSVNMGGPQASAWSAAVCWGKPGTPEFERCRTGHAMKMAALPLLCNQAERTGLFGRCRECDYQDGCYVCPGVFLAGQATTQAQRVPGFVCAFNACAVAAGRCLPALPLPREFLVRPDVIAHRRRSLRARIDGILGPPDGR
ncbi:MAG: radical SAM protein [Candidatus Krumholzibacteria bacterium]|nr:radical SAM protein [Candidatus Krumholzibacteria bacterium]